MQYKTPLCCMPVFCRTVLYSPCFLEYSVYATCISYVSHSSHYQSPNVSRAPAYDTAVSPTQAYGTHLYLLHRPMVLAWPDDNFAIDIRPHMLQYWPALFFDWHQVYVSQVPPSICCRSYQVPFLCMRNLRPTPRSYHIVLRHMVLSPAIAT